MIHAARLILAITATMLSGCAWAKYRSYEGGQQEQWPTSQGAFVERNHAIPAYFSPPPRPYRVIGYIDATTAPIRRGGVVAFAARRAKEQGADAIIVLKEGSEYGGSFAFASGSTTSNIGFHRSRPVSWRRHHKVFRQRRTPRDATGIWHVFLFRVSHIGSCLPRHGSGHSHQVEMTTTPRLNFEVLHWLVANEALIGCFVFMSFSGSVV